MPVDEFIALTDKYPELNIEYVYEPQQALEIANEIIGILQYENYTDIMMIDDAPINYFEEGTEMKKKPKIKGVLLNYKK